MDRTQTHFGLGFFAFLYSSWKTTPSYKKIVQKGQSKGQLKGHKNIELASKKSIYIFFYTKHAQ